MQRIIITNEVHLKTIKEAFKEGGAGNFHVLADFDRTLTTAFVDGKSVPSLISVLRDGNYLAHDYAEKAHALFNKYHPIEIDPTLSRDKKAAAMNDWWREHFTLLISSGLNKRDIEAAVTSGKVHLREGFSEFVDFLQAHHIPLVIMSSSGLGSESIASYLMHARKLSDNVHIICNEYLWDSEGYAVGVKEPVIHVLNKYETSVQNYPVFDILRDRKNVLLLGDSVDDIGMVQGFEYDHLLSVGFLNDKVGENIERYQKTFDVVITNDGSMQCVNELLQEIVL